jgi:RimJ/RimL family protein N-acetyltransferase
VELLKTRRLLLRHWDEPDLAAFFDLYSRDDVMRWLGPHPRRPLATQEEARGRLDRWHAREQELRPPLGLWAMVPSLPGGPPGHPVGTLLLLPLSDAHGPAGRASPVSRRDFRLDISSGQPWLTPARTALPGSKPSCTTVRRT